MSSVTLEIDNSICRIYSLNAKQYAELRDILCYTVDAQQTYFSKSWRSDKRYLIDKKGQFPTGLLYLVQKWCHKNRIEIVTHDKRIIPLSTGDFTLFDIPDAYPEQMKAAFAAWRAKRGIIVAPTGVGKSLICAILINVFRVKTLVVVPSIELKRQLTQSLKTWFRGNSLIRVENVDALDPNKKEDADLVIIDEFHHSGAATYRKLNQKAWSGVYYKIGLTATPFRSQDNERLLLESVLSEVIYRIDYKTAIDKGYIVPMEAYYIDLPIRKVKAHTWQGVYKELVVDHKERNESVAKLLGKIHVTGASTLCLVKEIKHGNNLTSLTGGAFANGQDGESAEIISAFNAEKLKTLIGTTGVLGEGVDTKPAEYIIIAGLGKSKNAFMQQVGRGFRRYEGKESCKVIIFRDASHKWTLAHFKAQCKYLRDEYGIKPVKLEI